MSLQTANRPDRRHVEKVLYRLLVRGVSQRDAAAYFDRTYHPDVTIHEPPALPYGGRYEGHDGVLRHAEAFMRTLAPLQDEVDQQIHPRYVIDGENAVVNWQLSFTIDGFRHVFPAMSHYRFFEGLIVESRMYVFDLTAACDLLANHGSVNAAPSGGVRP